MYVYRYTDNDLYTVGFYDPSGRWYPESDWSIREEAIEKVHYLNGGGISPNTERIFKSISFAINVIADILGNEEYRRARQK